jgi:hypothetical protein
MAITNAEAIRFSNEVIRPMAEQIRALKAEVDAALVTWFGGVDDLFPNSPSEAVEDGRESEGVSRLTGADVNNLVTQLSVFKTQLEQAGVADVVSKPCVRPLTAG